MVIAASPRDQMVARQIAARGVTDDAVLEAMREVPRDAFVPTELQEFAHEDAPLPIDAGQTISQPYIVALMVEALELERDDHVLEVGSGSGYAAAVMSRICHAVHAIERHAELVEASKRTITELGYDNIEVRHGDGTLGWPEQASFDAILVSAGGPAIPDALREQVKVGGRIVIPVGGKGSLQRLVRATRRTETEWEEEDFGAVTFVPLVGAQGWADPAWGVPTAVRGATLPDRIGRAAEPFPDLDDADLGPLLERIGDRRLVLIGEASHGTSEFYRMRARITRGLIEGRGFTVVAAEADWPDAARIDRWVRSAGAEERPEEAFTRFPTWMWRNEEVLEFVDWLRDHNERVGADHGRQAGFYGLDLYSMYSSIDEVVRYLDRVDPEAARIARHRYGCLTPFQRDPSMYGLAALTERYRSCEEEVVAMLADLRSRRGQERTHDGMSFLDVEQNARVAANAERYYRAMYVGDAESWNLRDTHMFETLEALLAFHGPASKAVVWAHNSHLGDASATAMARRGEINLGQLVREHFGDDAYGIGFGTDHGTVAAATDWDGPMEIKHVRPSHADSYERLCHESRLRSFLLSFGDAGLRDELLEPRLERAIGVIYRPETELLSHYFEAILPDQFDEWIWFDESSAVRPLGGTGKAAGLAEGHPFATVDR